MAHQEERPTPLSAAKRALMQQWSRGKAVGAEAERIPRRTGDRPARLSFTQQRVWLMEQLTPGTAAYHIADGIRLGGPLNADAVREALHQIVRRHDALRTTFRLVGGADPVQVVLPLLIQKVALPLVDLAALAEADRANELRRLSSAEGRRPFDLANGPLYRFTLYRLEPEEHVLAVTIHHLVADGWSMGVLAQELTRFYVAAVTGHAAELADLPLQYADWADWHRTQLDASAADEQLHWWKERLAAPRAVLELPADRSRPAVQRYEGALAHHTVPAQLAGALRALSQREGVSLFMTLLAAYKVWLHRYSGQTDLLVGTPVAGRNRLELEGLIGFFSTTLVIRTDLGGDPTFRELLLRVRESSLGALTHQDLPFERLVEELQPERSLSYSPLFQVGFALLNAPKGWEGVPGLTAEGYRVDAGAAKFDLWLSVNDDPAFELELMLEYSTDLFDAATIDRMLGHFQRLLEGIVSGPDTRLSALPLLTDTEWQREVVDWNGTAMPLPAQPLIHRLFEEQVRRAPDRLALLCDGERLSYDDLNRRANRLARQLRKLGVGPNVLVGVATKRSADMVVGLLAVLKAGGGYVPVDPDYPAERIAYMLGDSAAPVLLTDRDSLRVLPSLDVVKVLLDDPLPDEAETDLAGGAGPEDLAYVLYTSGSTGKPKGVQICHRNVVNLLLSMARAPGITPDDVLVAVTSISFDIAGLELYLPLVTGARLVVATRDVAVDGARLARLMAAEGATMLQATPVTWRLLEEAGWVNDGRLTMLIGGEALPRDLADRLSRTGPLWNMYGPTETTIWSAVWRVEPGGGPIAIGRPIANTQIYLLDGALSPVAVGVPGELYIGGEGLARGYLNQPDLTAERFLQTPFGRLYRTGDLARYRPDGNIEFLSRVDHQIKINGLRVETGEIEAALTAHTGVRQAAVLAREDAPGDKRLVGYVVPSGPAPAVGDLQAFLRQSLPAYMVPALFVFMERFPLTPNGKVDRKALPAPEGTSLPSARVYVAPRTPTEALVASIWAEVLRLEQVSVHENFFEAGGHSLMGIRLLAQIRDALGVELPLRILFEASTVEALAAAVDRAQQGVDGAAPGGARSGSALPDVAPDPAQWQEPFDLTYVQQTYLTGRSGYFDLGTCGTNFYLEFEATDAAEPMVERFNQAMRRLITRHDAFRTVLLPRGGQRILAPADVPAYTCPTVDLRGEPAELADADMAATRHRMKHAKADVYSWPLLEFRAHLLDGGRVRFLGRIEALILDGTSNLIFMRELFQLLENPEAPLEPFTLSFRDYAGGLAAVRDLDLWRRSKAYWEQRVQELAPAPRLPLAAPVSPLTESRMNSRVDVVLSHEEWQRFKSRAASAHLTPSAAVLTALVEVFAAFSRLDRFTLSLIASYRLPMHPDINRMVGNFNSISLLCVEREGGAPFRDQARRLQGQLSTDLEHMYYPGLLALQDWNRLAGAGARSASPVLANSLIEYSHGAYAARQLDRGGCQTDVGAFAVVDGHFTIPQILIEPIFWVEPDGTLATQWYSVDDAYKPGLIDAMYGALNRLLRRLANDEGAWSAARLQLLPEEQWAARAGSDLLVLNAALEDRPDWVPGAVYRVDDRGAAIHPRTGLRLAPIGQTGRHLPDGRVELLGPGDDAWAVSNGYDVELPQVEALLRQHPAIKAAALVSRGGKLVAYVVPEGKAPSGADLRRHLRSQVPGYMLPSAIIRVPEIPVRPDGHVDRAALPVRAPDFPMEPADDLEQAVMTLWGEVLDQPPSSLDDNFYELGGTSLSFLELATRVEARFGRKLPLTILADGATVAHMVAALREAGITALPTPNQSPPPLDSPSHGR